MTGNFVLRGWRCVSLRWVDGAAREHETWRTSSKGNCSTRDQRPAVASRDSDRLDRGEMAALGERDLREWRELERAAGDRRAALLPSRRSATRLRESPTR